MKKRFCTLFVFLMMVSTGCVVASEVMVSDSDIAKIEASDERANAGFMKSRDIIECIVYIENFYPENFHLYQGKLKGLFNKYSQFVNLVMSKERQGELIKYTYNIGYAERMLHDDFHLGLLLGEVRAQTEGNMKRDSIRLHGPIWSFYDYESRYRHEIASQLYNEKNCDLLN
ncbi:TPA: hypothetical protein JAN03_15065 [Citrobacter freundii]|nr:hypothetical protein [Citrobacter freundii]